MLLLLNLHTSSNLRSGSNLFSSDFLNWKNTLQSEAVKESIVRSYLWHFFSDSSYASLIDKYLQIRMSIMSDISSFSSSLQVSNFIKKAFIIFFNFFNRTCSLLLKLRYLFLYDRCFAHCLTANLYFIFKKFTSTGGRSPEWRAVDRPKVFYDRGRSTVKTTVKTSKRIHSNIKNPCRFRY